MHLSVDKEKTAQFLYDNKDKLDVEAVDSGLEKTADGFNYIEGTQGQEVDDETIVEAAKIAAWYSQARESGNVPVDYTQVKNVKKPSGARPGMVIYSTCRTVNVTPEEELVTRLSVRR